MPAIVKKIDRLPFWAWPPIGACAGTLAGGAILAVQILVGAIAQ